jgi:hypothetical protein
MAELCTFPDYFTLTTSASLLLNLQENKDYVRMIGFKGILRKKRVKPF